MILKARQLFEFLLMQKTGFKCQIFYVIQMGSRRKKWKRQKYLFGKIYHKKSHIEQSYEIRQST